MNTKDFQKQINKLFPLCFGKEIIKDLSVVFEKYQDLVLHLENYSILSNEIKILCDKIIEILQNYDLGNRSKAFTLLRELMGNLDGNDGLSSKIGYSIINKDNSYYRGRPFTKKDAESRQVFTINDIFHVPNCDRWRINENRYSYSGQPCLYLGKTIQTVCAELRVENNNYLIVSKFEPSRPFKLYDLSIPSDIDYSENNITHTIFRIPLIIACTIKSIIDKKYKLEYAIPQMLTEYIKSENYSLLEKKVIKPYDFDTIWGIKYTSVHINKVTAQNLELNENIIIPALELNGAYCNYVASLFGMSKPVLCKFNRERYDEINQLIEDEVAKNGFKQFPYLLVNSANNSIELDWKGNAESVGIISNVEWSIS